MFSRHSKPGAFATTTAAVALFLTGFLCATFGGALLTELRGIRLSPSAAAAPVAVGTPQQVSRDLSVPRRNALSSALLLPGLLGSTLPAFAFGPFGRGLEIPGYQGVPVLIPNAVRSSPVTNTLKTFTYPEEWPFLPEDYTRWDESSDTNFYSVPRFVKHIDDPAIEALTTFYSAMFKQAPPHDYAVLDICSSWVSHYPEPLTAKRVAITGMNNAELQANRQATDYTLRDLNKDPVLPYDSASFDFVTNVVSVDYLTQPRQVVEEVHRVMKPGGVAIFSFSNRCFFTKAVAVWVANINDGPGHCRIVATYFRFAPSGGWKDVTCTDVSPNPGGSDPMWILSAVKA